MSLGAGIVLFVIGAVLAFALNIQVAWLDLQLVGYILMAAGIVGIILGVVLLTRKRQSVATTRSAVNPASGEHVVSRTSESDDPLI